jgi:hypothetical protein
VHDPSLEAKVWRLVLFNCAVIFFWVLLHRLLIHLNVMAEFVGSKDAPAFTISPSSHLLIGILGSVLPIFGYFVYRFIWLRVLGYDDNRKEVLAALGVSFALATLLAVPTAVFSVVLGPSQNAGNSVLAFFPNIIMIFASALYFRAALNIDYWKAVLLNAAVFAMIMSVLMVVSLFGAILYALVIGVVTP